jgi:glycosyltransferase involved in cell wall biosynthesis
MKILIVASCNSGKISPFVTEQMEFLRRTGITVEIYGIVGKGIIGYLKNISSIRRNIKRFQPDLIHAHYGLSGLCTNMQREVPVITTYHGTDIHSGGWILKLSQLAMRLSAYNIFVSKKMLEMSGYKKGNTCVLSCGLDLDVIKEIPRVQARKELGFDIDEKIGLFSGSFDNGIKNYPLAKAAIDKMKGVSLIELKGYSRNEVNLLMNACDFQLTTSFRESGPLVVKEAMACGTPVVSVDVGDVKEVFGITKGCYIAERTPDDIAAKIQQALSFKGNKGKTNGRQRIIDLGLDNDLVSKKLIAVYKEVQGMNNDTMELK